MNDNREYTAIRECDYCHETPRWVVSCWDDLGQQEWWMLVCDNHKTTAFS